MAGKNKPQKKYTPNNSTRLKQRVSAKDDHILGNPDAPITSTVRSLVRRASAWMTTN